MNTNNLIPKANAGKALLYAEKALKSFLEAAEKGGKKIKTVAKTTTKPLDAKPTKTVTKTVAMSPEEAYAGMDLATISADHILPKFAKKVKNVNWTAETKGYNLGLHQKNAQRLNSIIESGKPIPKDGWNNLINPMDGTLWEFNPKTMTYTNNGKEIFLDGNNWIIAE